ncbi:hypothetical protein [Xenorhabdus bovienii]|uniref:hypothetical protein n=1 Tax=Xenorhabdus bovienii TaxID=40576 RepID=UPI0023B34443|nr:hypothetical protein [Xenorhabdus bovienii]MDE9528072.1 hypothetical protein [Xenorhabdus bovienii]
MKKLLKGYPFMRVPLFESGYIVFCHSWRQWEALHAHLDVYSGEEGSNGMSRTVSSESGVLHIIGVFNDKNSTLAHECAHVAFDICHRVGVNVSTGEANETFCYLISRLIEFCEKPIKKPE